MSDGLFVSIRTSAAGLAGMRLKMDTIARNLANAETTRTADGTPYRRQEVVFRESLDRSLARRALPRPETRGPLVRTDPRHLGGLRPGGGATPVSRVEGEVTEAADASDFKVVYDPGHPDADADGYVLLPNVNPITEMVDMITASRAYEANVSAVQAAKEMFAKALEI